jgi:quinolinate synthase
MLDYVRERRPAEVAMITECSMAGNLADAFPQTAFTQPCNLCPHMRRITLPKILRALETMTPQIEIEPGVVARARRAVERMTAVGRDAPLPASAA